jgi:hypothetical protein
MRLMTEDETAVALSCTKAALRRWRRERRGPRWIKLGRLVRYRDNDLEVFIEQNTEAVIQRRGQRTLVCS